MVELLVRVVGVDDQVVLDGRHVRHKVGDTVGVWLPAVVAQLADVPEQGRPQVGRDGRLLAPLEGRVLGVLQAVRPGHLIQVGQGLGLVDGGDTVAQDELPGHRQPRGQKLPTVLAEAQLLAEAISYGELVDAPLVPATQGGNLM